LVVASERVWGKALGAVLEKVLEKVSAFGTDGDGGGGDDGGNGDDDGGGGLALGDGVDADICQRVHRQSFPCRPFGAVEGSVLPNSRQATGIPHVSARASKTCRRCLRTRGRHRHCPELRQSNFRPLELRHAQFAI